MQRGLRAGLVAGAALDSLREFDARQMFPALAVVRGVVLADFLVVAMLPCEAARRRANRRDLDLF